MEEKLSNANVPETVGEVSFRFKLRNNKIVRNAVLVVLALVIYYFFVPKWDFVVLTSTQQNVQQAYNVVQQQPGMQVQQPMPPSSATLASAGLSIVKINKITGRVYAWAGDAGWRLLEKARNTAQ